MLDKTNLLSIREGLYLWQSTEYGNPYVGDLYHQSPLLMAVYHPVLEYQMEVPAFGLLHLINIYLLYRIANGQLKSETKHSPIVKTPYFPTIVYALNPITVMTVLQCTSVSLIHTCILISIFAAVQGRRIVSMVAVALAAHFVLWPMVLVVPLHLLLPKSNKWTTLAMFTAITLYLQYMAYTLSGGLAYIKEVYFWIMDYPDLTPNVGVFWYLQMEIFQRFRTYFLLVLHVHPYLYLVPLTLRLHTQPLVLLTVLFGVFAIYQPFPCVADAALLLCLMTMHPTIVSRIRVRFLLAIGLSISLLMLQPMWYIWLYPASGNANFYYAQTIIYQLSLGWIIIGFLRGSIYKPPSKKHHQFRNKF